MSGEADTRRENMQKLANTPGLDFTDLTRQALTGYGQNYDAAAALASKLSTSNQANLSAQEEQALPGIGAARGKALSSISSLFQTDPQFFADQQRLGAGLNLSQGLFGSGAGQLATLNRTSQARDQRTALGTGLLNSLIGSMRLSNSPGVQTFLGTTIQDQVAQRALERTQRMGLLSQAYGLPTGLEVWGNELQQVGKGMAGVGAAKGGGFGSPGSGGGGGGGGMGAPLSGDFGGGVGEW